ncbi:MAG: HAMP domain-containing protein, partial [Clostridiales bacterium]|nr:HAMP domain-containing protein [Clostridiales bacterium]
MNTALQTENPPPRPRSIARRLNGRFFFRLLGTFLALDIFLCFLFCAGLLVYAEMTVGKAAEQIGYFGEAFDSPQLSPWLSAERLDLEPRGFKYPEWVLRNLPDLQEGVRRFDFSHTGAEFRLWTMQNGVGYLITMQVGAFLAIFWRLLLILLIYQLIALIVKAAENARFVQHTLQPIEQLAQAARSLNREGALEIGELRSIAGKLDSINAARLGTRIDVDGAQDELKTLAAAINSMLDRINAAYRAQTRFVSDASHE